MSRNDIRRLSGGSCPLELIMGCLCSTTCCSVMKCDRDGGGAASDDYCYCFIGVGKDGHIGSLYPNRSEVLVEDDLVLAVDKVMSLVEQTPFSTSLSSTIVINQSLRNLLPPSLCPYR